MLLDVHHHVQVAWRSPVVSRLPLAGQSNAGAGIHAGRDLHRELRLAVVPAGPSALRARVGDQLAGAAALGARPRDGEETLGKSQLAGAAAGRAPPARSAPRSGPVANLAALRLGELDLDLAPECSLFERDLQVVAEVRAAGSPAAPAPRPAENFPEDVS